MELGTVYNSGFWDGYYLGRKMGEWAGQYGSQATRKKVYVGKIMNYFSKAGIAELKVKAQPLSTGDDILVIGPTTGVIEGQVKEIMVDEMMVDEAVRGDLCTLPVAAFLRPSDKLYKWIDSKNIPAQSD